MKKLTTLLILVATLAASGTSLARDRDGDRDRRGPPRDGSVAMEMVGHMHHALRQLDLSDDQKAAIKVKFKAMKDELRPLAEELRENRASLHELLIANDYNAAAVSAVADEQGEITADMIRLASSTIHSVMEELDDEQLAQLAEMRDQRRQRLQDHVAQLQKKLERMDEGD